MVVFSIINVWKSCQIVIFAQSLRTSVHVERDINKLEKKAWGGILVGYESDIPSYRTYDR